MADIGYVQWNMNFTKEAAESYQDKIDNFMH